MQLGRVFGIVFILLGAVMGYAAYTQLQDTGSTIKLFVAGPALIGAGVGFLIFPGGNITTQESRSKEKDPKIVMSDAPISHKAAWVLLGAVGFVIGEYFFNIFGFFL